MKERIFSFLGKCKDYLYSMEKNVGRYHYAFLSLFAGFCLGICPIFGFIVGYNYERAREGKADLPFAIILLISAILGNLLKHLIIF